MVQSQQLLVLGIIPSVKEVLTMLTIVKYYRSRKYLVGSQGDCLISIHILNGLCCDQLTEAQRFMHRCQKILCNCKQVIWSLDTSFGKLIPGQNNRFIENRKIWIWLSQSPIQPNWVTSMSIIIWYLKNSAVFKSEIGIESWTELYII